MTFQFPTPRRTAALETTFDYEAAKPDPEKPGLVQGRIASSINEWYVAKALWALQLEFRYQFPILGGTQRRGGIVIDFLVRSEPKWLPLEVQSERWHTGKFGSGERMRISIIENKLGVKVRFVWEDDTTNLSDAIQAVKKAVFEPAE